ncbi:MAG: hypothetical protein ABWY06_25045 [Pseudomonas sp.]|uniref:hypothetical protein n=1 Tax=Pseudomonas sp. TaxID=306 RepID=UPI0033962EE7
MAIKLPNPVIENILETSMPAFRIRCSCCADGFLSFQFQSHSNVDSFVIVGIRADECGNAQDVRRLGAALLEDYTFAMAGRITRSVPEICRCGAVQLPT